MHSYGKGQEAIEEIVSQGIEKLFLVDAVFVEVLDDGGESGRSGADYLVKG